MHRLMIDGAQGFRSQLDHILLIQEVLEEIPAKIGLQSIMPAFLLPYYNGVAPEDCGISAFVFLENGHCTIHTFSKKKAYFADISSRKAFDHDRFSALIRQAFPCDKTAIYYTTRDEKISQNMEYGITTDKDFGSHLLLEIDGYTGPETMDELFCLFDKLPCMIGMTPIMRPYILKDNSPSTGLSTNAITMIAESHISLHVLHDKRKAYFDLFSCKFFDENKMLSMILKYIKGDSVKKSLIARGREYKLCPA